MNMLYEEINPDGVTEADIAVFLPSFQEAANIAFPTRKAAIGLVNCYPQYTKVIVNCDNNSQDGTREAFFGAECETPRIYVSTPPGVRGRGANALNIFKKAADLSAKAIVIIDANLTSIKTSWMRGLLEPILSGCSEMVTPLYVRHPYDTPVTRFFAYPMMRSLFGRRVMQPICADRAFSARLNKVFLDYGQWELDDRGYSLDLTMLGLAIINQAPICQSFMAHPRVTVDSRPLETAMTNSFKNVAAAMFNLMLKTDKEWSKVTRSRPTALAGVDQPPQNLPPQVTVDCKFLASEFRRLGTAGQPLWAEFFNPDLAGRLTAALNSVEPDSRPLLIEDWREAIFSAAIAYKNQPGRRDDIVMALEPLLYAKCLTARNMAKNLNEQQYNTLLESEAMAFDNGKKNFVARWG
ncbi:MAG: hypothetical protein LBS31_13330 [Candidatus Adiutrix sp.]|jgi:hypothetical protein|nr:hypothetical protein [Candidatus Adiutrix sp.]